MSAAPETREIYPPCRTDPELLRLYASLLGGRRVAIVGPATTICGSQQGKTIDSYDLVVRINNQWPSDAAHIADIGTRGDILYHCSNGKSPIKRLDVPDFSRFRFAWYEDNSESAALLELCRRHNIPCGCYDEIQHGLIEKLGTVPNTGLLAIAHLLASDLSELYVTGFSFHTTRYYSGYVAKAAHWKWYLLGKPKVIGLHRFAPQRSFFKSLVDSDPRLRLDAPLQELVQHW
jgi:hypothetical protein